MYKIDTQHSVFEGAREPPNNGQAQMLSDAQAAVMMMIMLF